MKRDSPASHEPVPHRALSEPEVEALVRAVQVGVQGVHRTRRRRAWMVRGALAAAVLLLVCGWALDRVGSTSPDVTRVRAPAAVDVTAVAPAPAPAPAPDATGTAVPEPVQRHDDRIEAAKGTRFALEGPREDRVVHLEAGRVRCVVSDRAAGERFRVVVGGAEVEVTGTSFDVVAREDVLSAVVVNEGEVLVRLETGEVHRLGSGERWARREASVRVAPSVSRAPTPAVVPATKPTPPPIEVAFGEALARFDAADYAGAMKRFASIQSGPLAADARFWAAVSRVQMGRDEDALHVVEAALKAGVPAEREGMMHCLAGQLLASLGRVSQARKHLRKAASDDIHPAVAECGRGLDAP